MSDTLKNTLNISGGLDIEILKLLQDIVLTTAFATTWNGEDTKTPSANVIYDHFVDVSPQVQYLNFVEWSDDSLVNCTAVKAYDSTEKTLCIDIDNSGGVGSGNIYFLFQLPNNFSSFAGGSDDISIRAITDAGADRDSTITINFYDDAGADADDDTVSGTTLTSAWATYDCAVSGGTFSAGDYVLLKITFALPDNDDCVRLGFPLIKYNSY